MAEPRRLYLDTEFNSYRGELISMALVDTSGHEFYEVVAQPGMVVHPWVAEHVMPKLEALGPRPAVPMRVFQERLQTFLGALPGLPVGIEIVADYPDDIKYFCEALITGPGFTIDYPHTLHFALVTLPDFCSADESKVPHNALADARALRRYCTDPTYMPGWQMTEPQGAPV